MQKGTQEMRNKELWVISVMPDAPAGGDDPQCRDVAPSIDSSSTSFPLLLLFLLSLSLLSVTVPDHLSHVMKLDCVPSCTREYFHPF